MQGLKEIADYRRWQTPKQREEFEREEGENGDVDGDGGFYEVLEEMYRNIDERRARERK